MIAMRCPPAEYQAPPARGILAAARDYSRRFTRDEEGSLIVFGMFLFVLMMMMGGLAVDLMRYEQRRTALQQTIDRSVLAAASLTQDLDPEGVVNDYFDKAGLLEYLEDVIVTQGMNFRIVEATAHANLTPFFSKLLGIDDFSVPANSEAEQRITNVEIILVLDVSGSMSGAKISNLKIAAKNFVDKVKANDVENRISIGIVPYNAQVNLGAVLRGKYNATHIHGVANVDCLDLPQSVFSQIGMSRTTAYPMFAFADTARNTNTSNTYTAWNSTDSSNGATMSTTAPYCRNTASNIVRLPQTNPATIKGYIDGLVAAGNTSITLGMKWGVALIEPGARPLYSELIGEGHIPSELSGRPFDWSDEDAMKVIVVMTDGDHVTHTRVTDAYKTGMSPIWRSTADGNYSIRHTANRPTSAGTNEFWVPHRNSGAGEWRASAWDSGSGVTQLTWQEVWANQRVTWIAWQLYGRALGTSSSTRTSWYNSTLNAMRQTWSSETEMDASMQTSCTQAKDNGVLIYGIAFEAPAIGTQQIRACSSSDNYFFVANGSQINSAFNAIASNISQLRLTQ
jgi:hypothetical protein